MPKDRDQLTPDEPEDREQLATHRGQGTGGTGIDRLSGDEAGEPTEYGPGGGDAEDAPGTIPT